MTLTPGEIKIVRENGFSLPMAEMIRAHTQAEIEPWNLWNDEDELEPQSGISIAVADGNEAERLMVAIQPALKQAGYKAFWTKRMDSNGAGRSDEVAIIETSDPDVIVQLCRTGGENHGVFNDDILQRLQAWRQICEFDVVGASHDWVALQFSRLPEHICNFAVEVYQFCPDSVEQGVGLLREKDQPEAFAQARTLCPQIPFEAPLNNGMDLPPGLPPEKRAALEQVLASLKANSTPVEMGIRLLAHKISAEKYLFLWWD